MKIYCLFEGRHDLPQNEGALCASFDFSTYSVVRTDNFMESVLESDKNPILVIVTGLTPALTEFLNIARKGQIILAHFDSTKKSYWFQGWNVPVRHIFGYCSRVDLKEYEVFYALEDAIKSKSNDFRHRNTVLIPSGLWQYERSDYKGDYPKWVNLPDMQGK